MAFHVQVPYVIVSIDIGLAQLGQSDLETWHVLLTFDVVQVLVLESQQSLTASSWSFLSSCSVKKRGVMSSQPFVSSMAHEC